ncbi:hypothetical protein GCM10027418_29380 [Mariniluteicoccus endophyticus]
MLLTACAPGRLDLPDPNPADDARRVCTQVMANLPPTVLDQPRRKVAPGVLTAAWGDPPITLICGGELPPGMAQDTRCFEVNGVGWYAEEGQGGWLFTTFGREATVQLGVPNRYAPEANALVDVAAAISAHDRSLKPCL